MPRVPGDLAASAASSQSPGHPLFWVCLAWRPPSAPGGLVPWLCLPPGEAGAIPSALGGRHSQHPSALQPCCRPQPRILLLGLTPQQPGRVRGVIRRLSFFFLMALNVGISCSSLIAQGPKDGGRGAGMMAAWPRGSRAWSFLPWVERASGIVCGEPVHCPLDPVCISSTGSLSPPLTAVLHACPGGLQPSRSRSRVGFAQRSPAVSVSRQQVPFPGWLGRRLPAAGLRWLRGDTQTSFIPTCHSISHRCRSL